MKAGGNMAGKILMGQKELLRGKLLEMVKQGKMTLKAAVGQMQVSYRQGIRLYHAYREGGGAALIHGSRGKRSSRRTTEEMRERAVELYRRRYSDFGPTFAAEKRAEEAGLELSVSTLRRLLIAEGLWQGSRRKREYRSRREPRLRFGALVPFDGSPHDWLEGRGGRCCLITMIDDATKTRLSQFFEEETAAGAMTVLSVLLDKEVRDTPKPVLRP
jgi:transposase